MSEPIPTSDYLAPMRAALEAAAQAGRAGEVPVGAVLLDRAGETVAVDHNRREELSDPTAHAEILVLSSRARELGDWRLEGHTLVVTLEPCPMCAGAMLQARIATVVYGAADPKAGAVHTLYQLLSDARLNHRCQVVPQVLAEPCGAILSRFFQQQRADGKK